MSKLTKQGVRDLSNIGPKRSRNRMVLKGPPTYYCAHTWEHDPACDCRDYYFCEFEVTCLERCSSCGKRYND